MLMSKYIYSHKITILWLYIKNYRKEGLNERNTIDTWRLSKLYGNY